MCGHSGARFVFQVGLKSLSMTDFSARQLSILQLTCKSLANSHHPEHHVYYHRCGYDVTFSLAYHTDVMSHCTAQCKVSHPVEVHKHRTDVHTWCM